MSWPGRSVLQARLTRIDVYAVRSRHWVEHQKHRVAGAEEHVAPVETRMD
jgi:hypothetical protein